MKCVYGRAGVRYVITKFSGMDSLPNFLTHGAPLKYIYIYIYIYIYTVWPLEQPIASFVAEIGIGVAHL